MTTAGSEPPRYEFREESSFQLCKGKLFLVAEMDGREIDEHLFAIQDAIVNDPFAEPWSRPLVSRPGVRVAVSDPTDASPNALLVLFRVEGSLIKLLHVEKR